ncbi:MAG TPA: hypothetical protein VN285_12210 [Candidatus Deferrimicrobium sp.]|nr:hypothetical protein [Candidatus Deferrimicrobium sp.]
MKDGRDISGGLHKAFFRAVLCLVALHSLSFRAIGAANDPSDSERSHHPDGAVGRISFHGQAAYYSVSGRAGYSPRDAQDFTARVDMVASAKLVLEAAYRLSSGNTDQHTLLAAVKLYTTNPVRSAAASNPDGPLGRLVFRVGLGSRWNPDTLAQRRSLAEVQVRLPTTFHFTFSTGFRFYESSEPGDVERLVAGVSFFPGHYPPDSVYVNPDGPVNSPVFHLTVGGSSRGASSTMTLVLPIRRDLSLTTSFSAARSTSPYRVSLSIGGGLSVYPRL